MENAFISVVKMIVLVLLITTWTIIGFIFWIPLLARSTAMFSGLVVYVTISGTSSQVPAYYLQRSIRFYTDGFGIIFESIHGNQDTKNLEPSFGPNEIDYISILSKLGRFMLEILWTSIFWYGLYLLIV